MQEILDVRSKSTFNKWTNPMNFDQHYKWTSFLGNIIKVKQFSRYDKIKSW